MGEVARVSRFSPALLWPSYRKLSVVHDRPPGGQIAGETLGGELEVLHCGGVDMSLAVCSVILLLLSLVAEFRGCCGSAQEVAQPPPPASGPAGEGGVSLGSGLGASGPASPG